MLMSDDLPWVESWAKAAATHADVVRIGFRSKTRSGDWLERPSIDSDQYVIRIPQRAGPYRVTGRYSDLPLARRFARALDVIGHEVGAVDVVHADFHSNARWLPLAQRWTKTPYVVTEHSTAWSGENPDNQLTKRGPRHRGPDLSRRRRGHAGVGRPAASSSAHVGSTPTSW